MSIHHRPDVAEQMAAFFATDVTKFTAALEAISDEIGPHADPQKDEVFERVCAAVLEVRAACCIVEEAIGGDDELLATVRGSYREAIAPWLDRSWFMKRAKDKPRGYPGDYGTLSAIYDGETRSKGIGGYLDLYFLNTTLGRAVVYRMEAAHRFLVDEVRRREGAIHILNVASGPAREFVGGLDFQEGVDVRITCVDYDQEALDYIGQSVIKPWYDLPPIERVRYNALRMSSAKANIRQFGKPDIIYSVGLFDYIPDSRLVAMLSGLRQTLAPGGMLYVAFKDCREYDKTDYQWLVDWHFFQRTEQECRQLLLEAGFNVDGIAMSRDQTKSIMNFECRTVPSQVRFDRPGNRLPTPLSNPAPTPTPTPEESN